MALALIATRLCHCLRSSARWRRACLGFAATLRAQQRTRSCLTLIKLPRQPIRRWLGLCRLWKMNWVVSSPRLS